MILSNLPSIYCLINYFPSKAGYFTDIQGNIFNFSIYSSNKIEFYYQTVLKILFIKTHFSPVLFSESGS
jgi:hypothetical protein